MVTLFNAETVEDIILCLGRGDDINSIGNNNYTPLMRHSLNGNIEIVKILIENHCDVTYRTYGENVLELVCEFGLTEMVCELLKYQQIRNLINDNTGYRTCLSKAIMRGCEDIVDILFEQGADPNLICNDSFMFNKLSPLQIACRYDEIGIVDRILSMNVNIDINFSGWRGGNVLFFTTKSPILYRLLMYGANPNHQDHKGNTCIHHHISYISIKKIGILITFGLNINIQNRKGKTPCMKAIGNARFEIVKFLINAGADINCQDDKGKSCRDYFAEHYPHLNIDDIDV